MPEQLVRFYKNKLDEILCKLDSAKYARTFQQTNPKSKVQVLCVCSTKWFGQKHPLATHA